MGGGFEEEWITFVCMAESLHCPPETTTTLLIGYPLIQNKKLKLNKKIFKDILAMDHF